MTRFVFRLLLTVAAATFVATPSALAQEEAGGRQVKYKAKTEIDFEGVEVAGELVKPQGALLLDRKKGSFNPLIKLRANFNEEMAQSVNEVK